MAQTAEVNPAMQVSPLEVLQRWHTFAKNNGWTDADHHDADGTGWISLTEKAIHFLELRAGESLPLAQREAFRNTARYLYANDDVEIDQDAEFSATEIGSWVSAWLFVRNEDAGICRECGEVDADNGEGWDGLCGSCADKAEAEA